MSDDSKIMPMMVDWPYVGIARSYAEFQSLFGKEPKALLVGRDLWDILRANAISNNPGGFRIFGSIPIHEDPIHILGPQDFMFTW